MLLTHRQITSPAGRSQPKGRTSRPVPAAVRSACRPQLPQRALPVHAALKRSGEAIAAPRDLQQRAAQDALPPHVQQQQQQQRQEGSPAAITLRQKLGGLLRHAAKAAAVAGVAVALMLGRVDAAHAARSAGRVGGFSAPPSASRSYGGGGGGGYSRGGGFSGGVYSSPYSTYRAPVVVPSPPIFVPSPMLPRGVNMYGPGLTAGAAVVSTGPDIVDVAIVSMFLVLAASAATSALRGGSLDGGAAGSGGGRPTLTRVQVGLLSLARELKGDLDAMAARADTGSSKGLHQLLQEVVLALLRNPKYCVFAASSQKACSSTPELEAAFNSASVRERAQFEQETLVNVAGGAPRRSRLRAAAASSSRSAGSGEPDELVVVTLLVATRCEVDLPARISSLQGLRDALNALGGLPQDAVLGVELLWTPQAEGDYYTREEAMVEYPHLRQL